MAPEETQQLWAVIRIREEGGRGATCLHCISGASGAARGEGKEALQAAGERKCRKQSAQLCDEKAQERWGGGGSAHKQQTHRLGWLCLSSVRVSGTRVWQMLEPKSTSRRSIPPISPPSTFAFFPFSTLSLCACCLLRGGREPWSCFLGERGAREGSRIYWKEHVMSLRRGRGCLNSASFP